MAQPGHAIAGERSVTLPVQNRASAKKDKGKRVSKKSVTESPAQKGVTITRPTTAFESGGSSTYYQVQLVLQKKEKIFALSNSIEVSLGHVKRENLTVIITEILKELDFVMSFIQRAKSSELLRRDPNLNTTFTDCEESLFNNLAHLVKWVDTPVQYRGKMTTEDVKIKVNYFEKALEDLVHLMGEIQRYSDQQPRDSSPISNTLPPNMSTLSTDTSFSMRRVSTPAMPSSYSDPHGAQVSHGSQKKHSVAGPPTSPLHSPSATMSFNTGPPIEKVLCRPYRHVPDTEIVDNVELNNSHDRVSVPNIINETVPPPKPPRRANTNPRIEFNNDIVNGSRSNTESPELGGAIEEPPPIPVKKKNKKTLGEINKMSSLQEFSEPANEEPPPIPVKQRRAMTVTQSLDRHMKAPNWELSPEPPSPPIQGPEIHLGIPVPPERINSDPSYRRGPLPLTREQIEKGGHEVETIQKYNQQLVECLEEGRPALPPKKKHIFAYQGLFNTEYSFPEEIYDSNKLIVMTSEAPPPIPMKKKQRRNTTGSVSSRNDAIDSPPEEDAPPDPSERTSSLAHANNVRNRGSTDESLDEDEENLLEIEDVAAYLRFNKEDDGGYSLRGGPVDALISYAASPLNIADKHYTEAFLLIYPTFVTHQELINKLVHRLEYFYKENRQTMWTSCASLLVRVLKSVKTPLNQDVDIKVINLVYKMLSAKQLKFAQLLRDALIAKLKQLIPDNTAKFAPAPKIITVGAKKHSLFDFKPENLAKQMTLLDAEYFYKLDVYEMLSWAAEADEEKSPGLTKFTEHFNNVSQWTKTLMLDRSLDKKGRDRLMLYFISVMKSLRQHNNFNAYLAILSAIESAPISRLEWSERVTKNLEEPRALIDNKGSFKAYRDAFGAATPPCIPYIGLYLQDLTFINMVGDKLEDDKTCINFNKRWKQFNTVDKIRLAQTKQYTLEFDYEILAFFNDFEEHLSDADLYKISLEIKPKGGTSATT